MRIVKILALIFVVAALFAGALEVFNTASDRSQDLSLLGIWQRVAPGGPAVLRNALPSGFAQDLLTAIFSVPSWLACLCLAVFLGAMARVFGDDD